MVEKIIDKIMKSKNIVISGHIMPDGDAIGASFAMYYIIKKIDKNKNVKICFNDTMPKYTKKINKDITIYENIEDEIDLLISVDTANLERLAVNENIIKNAKNTICIDHHISNSGYFDINYIKNVSSACEIIFEFIEKLNITLDSNIAKYIYLGLVNDTGCFRHPNVTSRTFYIASKLLECNIDSNYITRLLFEKSKNKATIFSKSIIESIYDEKTNFMYYYITREEIEKNNFTRDDMEGTSEYMLSIDNVDLSLFMYELENGNVKGSFRSKGKIDVNKLASNFNGGGHMAAAGFNCDKKYEKIIGKIKEILNEKNN